MYSYTLTRPKKNCALVDIMAIPKCCRPIDYQNVLHEVSCCYSKMEHVAIIVADGKIGKIGVWRPTDSG